MFVSVDVDVYCIVNVSVCVAIAVYFGNFVIFFVAVRDKLLCLGNTSPISVISFS